MIKPLSAIAHASLGYKSLQNSFFYLNKATIETFGIEKRFLVPIFLMRDMDGGVYLQTAKPQTWLFKCSDKRADLRGTGALKYIDAMESRAAAEKKQAGEVQTIREALEAQGSSLWYAPKASPHQHHLWIRKAFDGVYAPFLFDKPVLVDQRCNSVVAVQGVEWREVAAALTTTLFAYSVEINGGASMGAGALEAPTTKLREYPVLDVTALSASERTNLVKLAEAVWANERPINWTQVAPQPGKFLSALDEWVLKTLGRGVSAQQLYADVYDACQSRLAVANDKVRKTKKSKTENIGNVAQTIASALEPKLQSRNFPDDFVGGAALDVPLVFDRASLQRISLSHFLDTVHVQVFSRDGKEVFDTSMPRGVAEGIVRAVLWGRHSFSVASDEKLMNQAIDKFLPWAAAVESDIQQAISESALGTGYEEIMKREVYMRLGVHPLAWAKSLPSEITL